MAEGSEKRGARTAVVPLRTASSAYSTWKRWPSGEKTVIARSYELLMLLLFSQRLPAFAAAAPPSTPVYGSLCCPRAMRKAAGDLTLTLGSSAPR